MYGPLFYPTNTLAGYLTACLPVCGCTSNGWIACAVTIPHDIIQPYFCKRNNNCYFQNRSKYHCGRLLCQLNYGLSWSPACFRTIHFLICILNLEVLVFLDPNNEPGLIILVITCGTPRNFSHFILFPDLSNEKVPNVERLRYAFGNCCAE